MLIAPRGCQRNIMRQRNLSDVLKALPQIADWPDLANPSEQCLSLIHREYQDVLQTSRQLGYLAAKWYSF